MIKVLAEDINNSKINIFWFRRDLRLVDNTALINALNQGLPVLPVFIFDTGIIDELPGDDPRISFIYSNLLSMNNELLKKGSSIYIGKGDPLEIWKKLADRFDINCVFINKDYEPYAIERDNTIELFLKRHNVRFFRSRDQVISEEKDIIKKDGNPYTVYTPYSKKWILDLHKSMDLIKTLNNLPFNNLYKHNFPFPSLKELGYTESSLKVRDYDLSVIKDYDKFRDYPAIDGTSYLSPHLRFGTVSIRKLVKIALEENPVFLSELIWREFFMQILFNFPRVVTNNFKPAYDDIVWRNDEKEFDRWCNGETGYPIVDAGMHQLNETGYMHNRVRMITAGFLCKHLLTDWRYGEAYFAQKLIDYELSSNNGNWQWAAGTGCDAAPWFRIFNPETQQKKFDPHFQYIRKWAPDFDKAWYPKKIVEHDFARRRAIDTFKTGIKQKDRKYLLK
jgi:deoxyribodipyrimidine photo-lyase